MITIQNLTLQRGQKVLFENANATIFAGQKVGLVGLNGSGKSSLFLLLLNQILPDSGSVYVQPNLKIAYLAQEVPNTSISALQYVMNGDVELLQLFQDLAAAEAKHQDYKIATLHDRIYELGGYTLEARAAKLLIGLGFSLNQHHQAVNAFSGGWRMRLNLAQVLMSRADLLMLDEPTNYLDMDAIIWLERFLQSYQGTLILISHDRDFLDNTVTKIIYAGNHQLTMYSGNYSGFEEQRAEHLAQERSLHNKQQAQIQHLNKFIERFRAKASKARQAQSRMKMLEKMQLVGITQLDSPFKFKFLQPATCGSPALDLSKVDVAYGAHQVLRQINFSLAAQDSVGILGINGAGKSTLVKTLAGLITPSSGEICRNKNLKIGYFAQHQVDQLDLNLSPIAHLSQLDPLATLQQLRTFLGGFGFSGDIAFGSVTNFSGGEKARLVLALIIWQKPNLLLLDEPTNHLDLQMREALAYALQEYEGALVLVAHDRYLLKSVVEQFYLVDRQQVAKFNGDLGDYQKWLLDARKEQLDQDKNTAKKAPKPALNTKAAIKPNHNKIKTLETEMNKLYAAKEQLTVLLSDNNIYNPEHQLKLAQYLQQNANIEEKINKLEEQWLNLQA